jgi:hypothetical protein
MDTMKYTRDTAERLFEHLPKSDDLTLIILKGHLLVEELMNEILQVTLTEPAELWKAKLSFDQRLCLLNALGLLKMKNLDYRNAIKRLNTLRNEVAHNLGENRLRDLITNFLLVFQNEDSDVSIDNNSLQEKLKMCITALHCGLNSYLTGYYVGKHTKEKV